VKNKSLESQFKRLGSPKKSLGSPM